MKNIFKYFFLWIFNSIPTLSSLHSHLLLFLRFWLLHLLHIHEIIQYFSFCSQFILLSLMSLFKFVTGLPAFDRLHKVALYVFNHSFAFIHPSVDELFHVFSHSVNFLAMKKCVQIFLQEHVLNLLDLYS